MKINFLGDIGLFRLYQEKGIDPFREVVLPEAQLNIGNFEFPVSRYRDPFFYDVQERYSCDPDYPVQLQLNKFHGFGLANNHILDYGKKGAEDTIDLLRRKGLTVFGYSSEKEGYEVGEFESEGISVAVIAGVKPGRWSREKHGFGPDSYHADSICKAIAKWKTRADHIVIYPHWGTELVEVPSRHDVYNARTFIEAGASAVVGHHPHICQGAETWKDGLIAYSLGSFIYIPEEELGYDAKTPGRNISACLTIDFGKKDIDHYRLTYYRYDPQRHVPVEMPEKEARDYAAYLHANIENDSLYSRQIKAVLLKRELRSFLRRFRSRPLATLYNYSRLIGPGNLKKLFTS